MTGWTGLVTRTRGLARHLLSEHELRAVDGCVTLRDLASRLVENGYLAAERAESIDTPAEIELACRRIAAARIAILERWTFDDGDVLSPFTLAEDVRSIRTLIRGAVAGAGADARLRGLIPTATLPVRALAQLAGIDDPLAIGAVLTVWRHPLAHAVVADHAHEPDLLRLDCRLLDAWARVAMRVARRHGLASIRRYVVETIDVANAVTARLLAEQRSDLETSALFVRGGARIVEADLTSAAATHAVGPIAVRVRARGPDPVLETALSEAGSHVESALLAARIAAARRASRRDPLDLAVVALFFLRLRAEQARIVRAAWACAMGVAQAWANGQTIHRSVAA